MSVLELWKERLTRGEQNVLGVMSIPTPKKRERTVTVSPWHFSFVWEHLDVGYVQGMCDLLAPLLVVLDNGKGWGVGFPKWTWVQSDKMGGRG